MNSVALPQRATASVLPFSAAPATPQPERVFYVAAARFVTIELAATITGLTPSAVRKRIERGFWLQDKHWRRAEDGRIWIDMKGVEQWVEGTE